MNGDGLTIDEPNARKYNETLWNILDSRAFSSSPGYLWREFTNGFFSDLLPRIRSLHWLRSPCSTPRNVPAVCGSMSLGREQHNWRKIRNTSVPGKRIRFETFQEFTLFTGMCTVLSAPAAFGCDYWRTTITHPTTLTIFSYVFVDGLRIVVRYLLHTHTLNR